MLKVVNIRSLLLDGREFARENLFKLVIAAALTVLGIVLGVRFALKIVNIEEYVLSLKWSAFIAMVSGRKLVAYFFFKLLWAVLMLAVFACASFFPITAKLSYLLFLFYGYCFALRLTAYVLYFRLAVLPYAVLCMVPFFIVQLVLLAFFAAICHNRACDLRQFGRCAKTGFLGFIKRLAVPLTAVTVLILAETLLALILTVGVAM